MVAGEPIVDHIRKAAEGAAGLSLSVPALRGAVLPQLELTNWRSQPARSSARQNRYQYSGCPPNPHNFLATVAHIITYGNRRNWMTKIVRPSPMAV